MKLWRLIILLSIRISSKFCEISEVTSLKFPKPKKISEIINCSNHFFNPLLRCAPTSPTWSSTRGTSCSSARRIPTVRDERLFRTALFRDFLNQWFIFSRINITAVVLRRSTESCHEKHVLHQLFANR